MSVEGLSYFGAAKRTPRAKATLSARMQAVKQKLAQRKAARCSKIQQHLWTSNQKTLARIQRGHSKHKDQLTARVNAKFNAAINKWSQRCNTPTELSATLTNDPSQDQNIVDASDYQSALADWQACMADQKTCATDDCGLRDDCLQNNDNRADIYDCQNEWRDCMAGDKTCATDYCGTKPVVGVHGLEGLDGSIFADVGAGAAGGSMLGPIGAIAGAAGGVLSSIFGGATEKDAAKAQSKALAQQKKIQQAEIAAQQQSEVFQAQQAALASERQTKTVLVGVAGLAGLLIVGALAWKIAKGRQQ